ncbi:MAG: hypothetical protein VR72_17535 [Clostridiaceae bacterium BRH_c20a]|nr:MAG: hypothetical protein VR72_17535 [Clostridiaceae bacterium BRH_c20a]
MDNITHGITGIGIGYIAQELLVGPQPGLVACALLASQFPDLDVIIGARSKTAYLKHHRGFSHSLLLAPLYAGLIAWGVKILTPQTSYWYLFLVSLLSLGLHLFFDLLNAYGTKLLWPISNRRFAWDILMIIDPLIILVFAFGLSWYLVNNQKDLLFSLYPFLGLYILAMLNFRLKARDYLVKLYKNTVKINLLPPILGWRRWNFIVEDENIYYLGKIDAYSGSVEVIEKLCPEEECSLVLSSKEDPAVQIFLEFARFPWYSKKEMEQDIVVKWSDLRYRLRERDHFSLIAKPKH